MNGKNILLIFLALIAFGLAYLRFRASSITPSPSPASSSFSPSPSPSQTADWPVYENEYFSLSYPAQATASARDAGVDQQEWAVTYMGNLQKASGRTQTELWDGYAVSVTRFLGASEGGAKLQAEIDRQGTIEACGEEGATAIQPGKIGQYDTLTYTGGCLGTAELHYFDQGSITYRITKMVEKPADQAMDYETITNLILSTFTLK